MNMNSPGGMVRIATRRGLNVKTSTAAFTTAYHLGDGEAAEKDSWTCEDGYRYPLKETLVDPWEQCYAIVSEFDEELIQGLKDEISNLLVVASLFLAIATAFVIESAKLLRPDAKERAAELLEQVVTLLNNSDPSTRVVESLPPWKLKIDIIAVNRLWFLSMIQSLAAVILGTLCLQWLSAYSRQSQYKTHDKALALRQMRYEGLIAWSVPRVPALLLLNVQAALVLFTVGLLWYLWYLNKDVALPVVVVAGVLIILLVLTTILPFIQSFLAWVYPPSLKIPQCPFKSPISFIIHRSVLLLSITGSYMVQLFAGKSGRARIRRWRKEQAPLLKDSLWDDYDELWRRKRESKGVDDANENGNEYSHYLVHGLASVMDTLIANPSAIHIVHNCLQDVHGATAHAKTFKKLFRQTFTKDEEELLDHAAIGGRDMFSLRKDFLSALVLQQFVRRNRKFHQEVLKHRVELFIRVNNTAMNEQVDVGRSVECPISAERDAKNLAIATRVQLLKCIRKVVKERQFGPELLRTVRFISSSIDPRSAGPDVYDIIRELIVGLEDQRLSGNTGEGNKRQQALETIRMQLPPADRKEGLGAGRDPFKDGQRGKESYESEDIKEEGNNDPTVPFLPAPKH